MGSLVLDTSVLLALFDPADALHQRSRRALAPLRGERVLTSTIVLAEVMVGAIRRRQSEEHRSWITAVTREFVAVDEAIALTAAELRASHKGLRLPDALIIATGIERGAAILTGEPAWKKIAKDIVVVV